MKSFVRTHWLLLLLGFFPLLSTASDLKISFEIPRLDVAEYHRPYTALWVERDGGGVVTNLAVLYDLEMKEEKGEEWLKDMRQWWRRTGRELEMPVDGVSGATRAPGTHTLSFSEGQAPLGKLTPGEYILMLEAAREVGGREVLKIPFQWPPQQEHILKAQGKNELGILQLTLIP